jgi:hypothetical protein
MKKLLLVLVSGVIIGAGFLLGNSFPVLAQATEEAPGEIDVIVVTPEEAFINKGSGEQFHAHAYDADGNEVEFNVVWATTGGTITQDGFYTASQGGCHQIFAIDEASGTTGEATVVVSCGEEGETCLTVVPGRVTMHVGGQIEFEVFEKGGSGLTEVEDCHWYVSGGKITQDGTFTAESLGRYTVTAVELESGRMGSAHVVVEEMHVLPWWAYTMMGSEWFWVMGLLVGLVAGLVVYMFRRSKAQSN